MELIVLGLMATVIASLLGWIGLIIHSRVNKLEDYARAVNGDMRELKTDMKWVRRRLEKVNEAHQETRSS